MKKFSKWIAVFVLVCLVAACLCACVDPDPDDNPGPGPDPKPDDPIEEKDYVSELKLNMSSSTKKTAGTVKTFIDGDTTHFNVSDPEIPDGVLKARYLAVDTPESTGQIEEYGKQASNFTKSKLSSATSIMLESNSDTWNKDSTGSRYLVFVWYKTSEDSDWRNLNLELLQNGFAFAKNTMGNIYGETCMAALNQAKALKLKVYSGEPDPLFYYGEAMFVSLKTLRCDVESYNLKKVAFDGVVTRDYNDGVYVENYDEEAGMYFGMYVYYGNGAKSEVLSALSIGNYVRVVGNVTEYNGSWQVSGVEYDAKNKGGINTEVIPLDDVVKAHFRVADDGYVYQPYTPVSSVQFVNGKKTLEFTEVVEVDGQEPEERVIEREFDLCQLLLGTTVSMENLRVISVSTTASGTSAGAMTLTCNCNGLTIKVRTAVLKDSNGQVITADEYQGKYINIKGVVDLFQIGEDSDGTYQIKVLSARDIKVL